MKGMSYLSWIVVLCVSAMCCMIAGDALSKIREDLAAMRGQLATLVAAAAPVLPSS